MDDERAILAIGRIERALARIERARLRPAAGVDPARHEALRRAVEEAADALDRLAGEAG